MPPALRRSCGLLAVNPFAVLAARRSTDHSRSTSTLASEVIGAGSGAATQATDADNKTSEKPRTAVLLHGLLGSGKNWRSFARRLARELSGKHGPLQIHLVDLRNHGASRALRGVHPPHDLTAAAEDVARYIRTKLGGKAPDLLIGHSLGGKVALELLRQLGNGEAGDLGVPKQVWVLDSQPGTVPSDAEQRGSVAGIIDMISGLPSTVPSRQWLYERAKAHGLTEPVTLWLGSNLTPAVDGSPGLHWTFNIQGASAMYSSYRSRNYWPLLERPPPRTTLHLLRAAKSDRWTPEMLRDIQRAVQRNRELYAKGEPVGKLREHVLADAGHWVHSDNPDGLLKLMTQHDTHLAGDNE